MSYKSRTLFSREDSTPFDANPPEGFFYLNGDLLALLMRAHWVKGEKFPMIAFPSGEEFQIWSGSQSHTIHVFGEMDLRLTGDDRDAAFEHANDIAEQCGYLAIKQGSDKIEVIGNDKDEHYIIVYDNVQKRMIDIRKATTKREKPPTPPLIPDDMKEKIPKLYTQEHLGWDAIALVKLFTPDAGWTVFISEWDGSDLCFGLIVSPTETQLGYFSLTELKSVRGRLGLPIERDLYYKPKSLKDAKAQQNRLHGRKDQ